MAANVSNWPRAASRDEHTQLEIRQAAIDGTRPVAVSRVSPKQPFTTQNKVTPSRLVQE